MRGGEAREGDGERGGRDGKGWGKKGKKKVSENISYGSRLVQPWRKMSEGGSGWVFLKLQHRGAKVTPTGGKKVRLMLQSKSVKSQVGRSRASRVVYFKSSRFFCLNVP